MFKSIVYFQNFSVERELSAPDTNLFCVLASQSQQYVCGRNDIWQKQFLNWGRSIHLLYICWCRQIPFIPRNFYCQVDTTGYEKLVPEALKLQPIEKLWFTSKGDTNLNFLIIKKKWKSICCWYLLNILLQDLSWDTVPLRLFSPYRKESFLKLTFDTTRKMLLFSHNHRQLYVRIGLHILPMK